jgi:DNA-binding PadR family transcriptional regulator
MSMSSKQSKRQPGQLGFTLLGLLQQAPRSGYALMRLFAVTPMRHFSDSPGAIYPALRRLEKSGLIRGVEQPSGIVRRQQVFHVTDAGRDELVAWLTAPVTVKDVEADVGLLMLRLSLHSGTVAASATRTFLVEFGSALDRHLEALRAFYREQVLTLPLSARLALDGGIQVFEARRRWLQTSLRECSSGRAAGGSRRIKESRRSSA